MKNEKRKLSNREKSEIVVLILLTIGIIIGVIISTIFVFISNHKNDAPLKESESIITDSSDSSDIETSSTQETEKIDEEYVKKIEKLLNTIVSANFIKNTTKFADYQYAYAELDKFIKIYNEVGAPMIEIIGCAMPNFETDPKGTYCQKLAEKRAEVVKNYLVSKGIPEDIIIVTGVIEDTGEDKNVYVLFKIVEE